MVRTCAVCILCTMQSRVKPVRSRVESCFPNVFAFFFIEHRKNWARHNRNVLVCKNSVGWFLHKQLLAARMTSFQIRMEAELLHGAGSIVRRFHTGQSLFSKLESTVEDKKTRGGWYAPALGSRMGLMRLYAGHRFDSGTIHTPVVFKDLFFFAFDCQRLSSNLHLCAVIILRNDSMADVPHLHFVHCLRRSRVKPVRFRVES
ncbi:hypothetical protein C8F04DRAFT_1114569 [Mycena alexandri]|uniref:Uncharacterized protein n=1 Tax=Mycena alexandri TaxID=1745969 RepID=A0AAD6WWK3_9AGAR|nr:hypothetical protein C8F04DRAFT_1114569 [Mycena alexandri]